MESFQESFIDQIPRVGVFAVFAFAMWKTFEKVLRHYQGLLDSFVEELRRVARVLDLIEERTRHCDPANRGKEA